MSSGDLVFDARAVEAATKSKRRDQVTVPDPVATIPSLLVTVLALKELVEELAGQRGSPTQAAVTYQALIDLQMLNQADVPRDLGTNKI